MTSSHIEEKTEALQAMASDFETEDVKLQKMMQLEQFRLINMDELTKVLTCLLVRKFCASFSSKCMLSFSSCWLD